MRIQDPDPHYNICGSTSLVTITNIGCSSRFFSTLWPVYVVPYSGTGVLVHSLRHQKISSLDPLGLEYFLDFVFGFMNTDTDRANY